MRTLLRALVLTFVTVPALAADVEVVRAQFIGYYTAAGSDAASPRMRASLQELEGVSRQITGPGWFRSDGSWLDIDYSGIPDGGWGPWEHTRRLIYLARAYRTPGQSAYLDPRLLADINAALAYTRTFYGAGILPRGNWWFWTIGIPIDLGPTLVLMQGHAEPQLVDELASAIELRIRSNPSDRGIAGPIPTGQNLVWSAFTHLSVGLLRADEQRLELVREAMARVTLPASGDGIKSDRSFHQHGAQLYTGGYGGAFGSDVARYALLTRGTRFGLPPASLASMADYVADGIAWTLYGRYFDVSVISREVARPTTIGYNGLAALLQAAAIESERRDELRAAAAKMLETWPGTLPIEMAGLAAQIESSGTAAAWPSGHRHYYASDYTVHRRPGWFASVKMVSTRTKSGESTNGENLLGSRQSDGRFYLAQRGDEYFGRDVWPALDWTRLPGTTVEQKADTASDFYGYGRSSFAGGTGDGTNGVSAMVVAPLGSSLTARKAWFFFDDAIVFLTNGITSPSANRVETIVNQWPLLDDASQVAQGTDWAALEDVGYWFPSPARVEVERTVRTGTWAALGGSADTAPRSRTFVTMGFDHGIAPVNASAEYAIVPGKNATEMAAWAASRPIAIVANNEVASAARDLRTGALGIAFWRAGSVEGVQSSSAAVIHWSGDTLTAADPNGHATGSFEITIPGRWVTRNALARRTDRSTTLTIPRNSGRTTTVHLTRATPRRRAVR
jgi:chondroitin AC lyase